MLFFSFKPAAKKCSFTVESLHSEELCTLEKIRPATQQGSFIKENIFLIVVPADCSESATQN